MAVFAAVAAAIAQTGMSVYGAYESNIEQNQANALTQQQAATQNQEQISTTQQSFQGQQYDEAWMNLKSLHQQMNGLQSESIPSSLTNPTAATPAPGGLTGVK